MAWEKPVARPKDRSLSITLSEKVSRSLVQIEVKPAAGAVQRGKVRSASTSLIKNIGFFENFCLAGEADEAS